MSAEDPEECRVPVWQRKEIQEMLRQIDAFGTTSRQGDVVRRLMRGARQVITFDKHSSRQCLEKDEYLAELRTEYSHKMELFLTLTTLPADEPDLSIIIDRAGEFLLDAEDYERARQLYAYAEKAFPDVVVYPAGLSYCLGRLQLHEEAVDKARRAVELYPVSHILLNDLGWTLYQAGYLEEAEATLEKPEIKRGFLSPVQGNDSIGIDSMTIHLDILQDPQEIGLIQNLG